MIWVGVFAADFVVGLAIGTLKDRSLGCAALVAALLWPLLLVVGLDAWDGFGFALWEFPAALPGRLVLLCGGLLITRTYFRR